MAPMRVTMVSTVVTPRPTLAGAAYLLTAPIRVTMVSTVVTPRPTLAGAEARSSQKLTHDMHTIILEGMYTCSQRKKLLFEDKKTTLFCRLRRCPPPPFHQHCHEYFVTSIFSQSFFFLCGR
jgi:hypothetical protein